VAQALECTTEADAARRLGVTRHCVNNLIQMGRIRAEQLADGAPVIPLDASEEHARQRQQRVVDRAIQKPAKATSATPALRRQPAPAQHCDWSARRTLTRSTGIDLML
jgi:hypothetical protein